MLEVGPKYTVHMYYVLIFGSQNLVYLCRNVLETFGNFITYPPDTGDKKDCRKPIPMPIMIKYNTQRTSKH